MSIDVSNILSKIGIDYTETTNGYRASCPNPNHSDSTPSWNIESSYPYRHNCFGCGYKGNVYTLARDFGIELDQDTYQDGWGPIFPKVESISKDRQWIPEIKVSGEMKNPIMNGEVMKYLKGRGVSAKFIQRYKLTYSDEYLRINETNFTQRVCTPIVESGVLWSVEGRAYKGRLPKVLYPKGSRMDTLFDIDNLKKDETLYVVEGIMDLPPLFEAGFTNITALFGATIAHRQKELLNQFKEIFVIPDNDTAGDNIVRDIPKWSRTKVSIGVLPANKKDPGECSPESICRVIKLPRSVETFFLIHDIDTQSTNSWSF